MLLYHHTDQVLFYSPLRTDHEVIRVAGPAPATDWMGAEVVSPSFTNARPGPQTQTATPGYHPSPCAAPVAVESGPAPAASCV